MTLQGWLGTAGGNGVKGRQTDPGYGPLLPRLPASGGVRAALAGNMFSGLSKAAQPICPGQRWGRSKPCSFGRELKPEIGEDSLEVSGSGWASLSSGLSAFRAWPWGFPPQTCSAGWPQGLAAIRSRAGPSWAVTPESQTIACLLPPRSPGVYRHCSVSAGEGLGQQPLLRQRGRPHLTPGPLIPGSLVASSQAPATYHRAGAGRGRRAGPWAGAVC